MEIYVLTTSNNQNAVQGTFASVKLAVAYMKKEIQHWYEERKYKTKAKFNQAKKEVLQYFKNGKSWNACNGLTYTLTQTNLIENGCQISCKNTIRRQVMDFIEQNGGTATRNEIVTFILKIEGYKETYKEKTGYHSPSFKVARSPYDKSGYFMRPSRNDNRYLWREGGGVYSLLKA